MAELVKLRTTSCGAIIVVAKIGEKAAEPRSGSVVLEKVATLGMQSPRTLTKCTYVVARSLAKISVATGPAAISSMSTMSATLLFVTKLATSTSSKNAG